MRKERLELSRLSAPAPKAGASTNSATFAADIAKRVSIAEKHHRRHAAACATTKHPVPAVHYENFPVASRLAPARIRAAIAAIYAFARSADDIADEGNDPPLLRLERLDAYLPELDRIAAGGTPTDPPFAALVEAVRRHDLPLKPFRDLLSAFRQDVLTSRYPDYASLLDYCSRSANPIGRLLLHLYGISEPVQVQRADAICTALQLVNFWQDVAIDWRKGRVYVPQQDLASFGVSEAQIAEGRCDERWRRLLAFEVERARGLLESGCPLASALPLRTRLELRMTIAGGLRILAAIDAVGGDVFRRRPVLRRRDWSAMAASALLGLGTK